MELHIELGELELFAETFWRLAGKAKVFAFHGEMGAGKTTLIAALCRNKGVKEAAASPTFSIINEYEYNDTEGVHTLYHIDLYRLKSTEEIMQAGVEDCIFSGSICFVEWPEKAPFLFDEQTLNVYVQPVSETERLIKMDTKSSS